MKKYLLLIFSFCFSIISYNIVAQNSLAVTVFHDNDGNGLQDGGDLTIPGVTTAELQLFQDVNGNGSIDGGDVEFMHDGGVGGIYTYGVGNVLPNDAYILIYNEAGLPGGASGEYYVTQMGIGVGVADMDNDIDPIFNTAGFNLTGVASDMPQTFIDLGLVIAGNIGSFVWEDIDGNGIQDGGAEVGRDGVSVTLLDAMTGLAVVNDIDNIALVNPAITAGGGIYTFADLAPGQYIVEFSVPAPSPELWYPTQVTVNTDADDPTNDSDAENNSAAVNYLQSHTIVLLSDETDEETRIDAGFFQASVIGDWVWEDLNGDGVQDPGEPGLNGITVSLLDNTGAAAIGADGQLVPDQITANVAGTDGIYQFMLVAPGDYQVQFSLPAPIGGDPWYPTEFDPAHTDANDPDTDSDANNDPADVANYLKSHVITIISGETDEELRIDAGFWFPANVGNMVFCDRNGNGINEPAAPNPEAGVDGVTVFLLYSGGPLDDTQAIDADGVIMPAETTAGGGFYEFDLVPPGNYKLRFEFNGVITDPPYQFTIKDAAGSTDDDDSDVNDDPTMPKYGETDEFNIVSQDMDEETMWDAGVFRLIDISGTVWFDSGGDQINNGEPGPGGVPMVLTDVNGVYPPENINSTTNGEYNFLGIPPGQYTITILASAFAAGNSLTGTTSCMGTNDANNMVDNDDNGPDTQPGDIVTTTFDAISNCDGGAAPLIDYVDFCFEFDCGTENDIAAGACDQIDPINTICDVITLEAFCNLMPTGNSGGNQPSPQLCPTGGAPHNISWFAFVAYEGNYAVTVTPTNCTDAGNGNMGVQIGLYTDCTFTETVYCNPNCETDPVTFESDGSGNGQDAPLVPGQTYYFFIDGCAGSVCSYDVSITGNPSVAVIAPTDMCILDENDMPDCTLDDHIVCPGSEVSFQVQGIDLTVDYTWMISTDAGGPFTGGALQMSTDENLTLVFENVGEYTVCVNTIDNGCSAAQWNGDLCKTVLVQPIDNEEFSDQTICFEDLGSFMFDVFDPEDPNMDGEMGWMVIGATPVFDVVSGTVTRPDGCMYDQEFELFMHPIAVPGIVDSTICRDELPLFIDGISYDDNSFAGDLVLAISPLPIMNDTDINGCDSVIDLTIEILDIFNGVLTDGICTPDGITLNFEYGLEADGFPSTEAEFITWVWTDSDGMELPDLIFNPNDPLDNMAPSGENGTYTLTATIDKNGKTCEFVYSVMVDFDQYLPIDPEISGPDLTICEADSIAIYAATNFGTAFNFAWTFPNDVTATTSGSLNDTLTVNWAGSTGGEITLISSNGCGESGEVPIMVTIIPQPTPSFDFITEACVDSCIIIEFVGDATDLTFTWDFDGGVEDSGSNISGPGPHCVSWSTAGDKVITLTYTDNFGCESTMTQEMVTVIEPLEPPMVNCISQMGEVVFSWDLIPGTVEGDYSVEITTPNQTGTLDGTTFTITDLMVLEQVNITLTILTNDACEKIEAFGNCIAQDCTPPMVSISSPGDLLSFCLNGTDQSFDLIENIPMGVPGSGVFMGTGIVDTLAGTFNPDSALVGNNTIFYTYFTDDGCIAPAQLTIEVFETPVASFNPDIDTICITNQLTLTYDGTPGVTYDWDYGVDGTGTGGPTPTVTYTSPGEKTIRLIVMRDGCVSESDVKTVFVQDELQLIEVICSMQTIDEVGFTWGSIPGATGYSISVDGGPPIITTQTSYGETGLSPNDTINISVTVLTDNLCGGNTGTGQCIAQSCPTFDITVVDPVLALCVDANFPIQDLGAAASATGGDEDGDFIWSGQNVVDNQFDPNGLPEGSYTLIVIYQEETCQNSDSMRVEITTVPTAAFSVDNSTICIGETVTITYEGSQLPNETLDWSPPGQVTQGVNPNEWVATFNSVGTSNIELDVMNGNCDDTATPVAITVEPELNFGDIDCVASQSDVNFTWSPVDCATEYEVFIDGVSQGLQTTTEYNVSGLGIGVTVEIDVIAISDCACGNVPQQGSCTTEECTLVLLELTPVNSPTEFCISEGTPIEIMPSTQGTQGMGVESWSGSGVDQDGIFDPLVAGVGTHTIFYDFLESEGCPYRDSITFTIYELPEVDYQFDEIMCYNQTTTMLEVIPTGGTGVYTITLDGNDAGLMNDVEPDTYTIVVSDENLCTAEISVTITAPLEPSISISGSTELNLGDSSTYSIDAAVFAGTTIDSIIWSANGNVICNDPGCFSIGSQSPIETTVYDVAVFYNGDCPVTASLTVEVVVVEPPSIVEIPNIISPNADGENDEWQIVSNDEEAIINSIRVFDRWGNMVWGFEGPFPAKDNNVVWNGRYNDKVLQPGVYVYFVDLIQEGRSKIRSGDLTIIN